MRTTTQEKGRPVFGYCRGLCPQPAPVQQLLCTTNQFLAWFTVEDQQAIEWETIPHGASDLQSC